MIAVVALALQTVLALSPGIQPVRDSTGTLPKVEFPPNTRAAVLGQKLYSAASDPSIPLAEIMATLENEPVLEQLKQRALIFADLQLRGLRRYCAPNSANNQNHAEASYAHIPAQAFSPDELAATALAIPLIKQKARHDWSAAANKYHREIRALKQNCRGAPQIIQHISNSFLQGIKKRPFLGKMGGALRSLTQDYLSTMDIESAFPRVQYAVNGLSYRLGMTGVQQVQAKQNLHRFIQLYKHFAEHPEDHRRIFDLAIEASQQRPMQALWILTFAFRNFPHIYDVYLINPKAAAQLEVLFFRLKYYRNMIRHDDVKMRLHYPAQTYRPGDKRASPYHYWSAGYVAMRLTEEGHRPVLAALLGGMSQVGYEVYSAYRFAKQKSEGSTWWCQRFIHFAQGHATLNDASGGMLGAFETVSLLRRWMPIQVDSSFLNLRREAWRLAYWSQSGTTQQQD